MCGRLSQTTAAEKVIKIMKILGQLPPMEPRYNIAPSLPLAAIRQIEPGANEWAVLSWGLIPAWAKEKKSGYSMFNARGETVAEKPAYRAAFRYRRCLIPADHYFEWKEVPGQTRKQPYEIRFRSGDPMLFAGLWEHWEQENEIVDSCTIITTDANAITSSIHDRMPVIIPYEHADRWLDVKNNTVESLKPMLLPYTNNDEIELQAIEPGRLITRKKKL